MLDNARSSSVESALASVSLLLMTPLAGACGPQSQGEGVVAAGPIDLPSFAVSDFFTPSGHMGDGEEPGHVLMNADEHCRARPSAAAEGRCYRFVYGPPGSQLWAGVFWAFPANNWGAEPGRSFRPWVFDPSSLVIRQRYNRVRFWAAARRDVFELSFRVEVEVAGERRCYSLRNATFQISGDTDLAISSEVALAASAAPDMFSPCPEATTRLILSPGNYSVTLQPGWSLQRGDASVPATALANPLPVSVLPTESTQVAFEFQAGDATVGFPFSTPPLQVAFFAGGIDDGNLVNLQCPDQGQRCDYRDNVLSGSPKTIATQLTRQWRALEIPSSVLRFEPPCVNNAQDEAPAIDAITSTVACPDGTWTTDGLVAGCPLGLRGALQADGQIACCDGSPPERNPDGSVSCGTDDFRDPATGEFVSVPKPVFSGTWMPVEDIEGTLVGAFGWSTSYADFETQPGSGQLTTEPDNVPLTTLHLDGVVWDYAQQP